jgi:hypothetical protein
VQLVITVLGVIYRLDTMLKRYSADVLSVPYTDTTSTLVPASPSLAHPPHAPARLKLRRFLHDNLSRRLLRASVGAFHGIIP